MKKLLSLLVFLPFFGNAQDYLDVLTLGYGQTFNNDFEGTDASTKIKSLELDFTFPLVLNPENVIITGALFSKNSLQLYPDASYSSLYSSTLKIGWAKTYSEQWSTTLVALPKIASDYQNITSDDFYLGGVALLKFQKKKNLIYKFGMYGSNEAFGFFTTPIIGWYYLSPNQKFEMDTSLPISANINYTTGAFTYGFDYMGIGRSFNITTKNATTYVDLSNLEFASYLQYNAFEKSVLLRAKLGYSTSNYEVYEQGEKIDLGLSAFSFGDDRTLLNPEIGGGVYLKFEAVYRFNIQKKDE